MSKAPKKIHVKYLDKAKLYMEKLKSKKQTTAADARRAAQVADEVRNELLAVMGDSETALCGNLLLIASKRSGSPACITLSDGRRIEWGRVKSLMVGNETIKAEDVMTLYGGKSHSFDLNVVIKE